MASARDDMVIRPRIVPGATKVRERAKEERAKESAVKGRHSILRRLVRNQIARRLAGRAASVATRGLSRMVTSGASRAASRGAVANPIGLIVAAVAVAVVVGARLASGRSFENMGANVKQMILGDIDEESLAGRDARNRILNNPDALYAIGKNSAIMSQARQTAKEMSEYYIQGRRGDAKLMEDAEFQVNGVLDSLILRLTSQLRTAFIGGGGGEVMRKIHESFLLMFLVRFK